MTALHWARVDTVYYGASIADAGAAGFNELYVPAADVLRMGRSHVQLIPNVMPDECKTLFREWKETPGARAY
jgi:tRNA(Arg) A34 adenosine deaminase TadA